MDRYNHKIIEPQQQSLWEQHRVYEAETSPRGEKPLYYVLEMFPYPSGRIHMGHVRNYAMGDVVARYKRARGFDVLHPMGWGRFWYAGRKCCYGALCPPPANGHMIILRPCVLR